MASASPGNGSRGWSVLLLGGPEHITSPLGVTLHTLSCALGSFSDEEARTSPVSTMVMCGLLLLCGLTVDGQCQSDTDAKGDDGELLQGHVGLMWEKVLMMKGAKRLGRALSKMETSEDCQCAPDRSSLKYLASLYA